MDNLILVDTSDRPIGICDKQTAHARALLHRAFSVFLTCGDQMLLQKRSREKYHSGGLWANACCSHPRAGEALQQAVSRRMEEELNLCVPVRELFSFIYCARFSNGLFEYEYDHVFWGTCNLIPHFNPQEIEQMRWISFHALRQELIRTPDHFSVWFLSAAPRVLRFLEETR